jgi:hypothetical protein
MSYETCFVVDMSTNPSINTLMAHPVMQFKVKYDKALYEDKTLLQGNYTEYFTENWELKDAEGQTHHGAESVAKLSMLFSMMSDVVEHCTYAVIQDAPNGWTIIGEASWFLNFVVPGEKKVTDMFGKQWEFSVSFGNESGVFHHQFLMHCC